MTITSDKVLKNIKEKHIQPEARWRFLAKDWTKWFIFRIALLIAALSFAAMLDVLINHDWDIYLRLHKSFWQFLILSLPYIWIVSMAIFSWIAYYDFVHTKGWYRHSIYTVILGSILFSLVLGFIFFYSGLARKIDHVLDAKIPFYSNININKRELWCHPEKGLLGGEIMRMKTEVPEKIIVKDCKGQEWEIMKPAMLPSEPLEVGERIKMIGHETEQYRFDAEEFRNW